MSEIPNEENAEDQLLNEISELSKRGYQLLKEGLLQEAENCFKEILEKDDLNNYALVGLGDSARKRGDFRQAVVYYQKCLDNHPGNNYALFGLADCYKALKKFKNTSFMTIPILQSSPGLLTLTARSETLKNPGKFISKFLKWKRTMPMPL
jgi:tetratricopeptide (TPR) repeat protein